MKKIALVALALVFMTGPAFAKKNPKATHPPVLKHHMDKSRIGKHVKPHYVKVKHATGKHPKAKNTNLQREGNKKALKASKKHHRFLFFK
jgi:hypothetical protein